MRQVKFDALFLSNFKGVGDYEIRFNANETTIMGANGTGKTRIADALSWVLFGKDYIGRTVFDLKPLDSDGAVIPKMSPTVELHFRVNDQQMSVKRTLHEVWDNDTFVRNKTQFFFNEIELSQKDFNARIDAICDERLFKVLSRPDFFPSLDAKEQLAMLCSMNADLSDEQIAQGKPVFEDLLLRHPSLEDLEKQIKQEKSRCKKKQEELSTLIANEEKKRAAIVRPDKAALLKEQESIRVFLESIPDNDHYSSLKDEMNMLIHEHDSILERDKTKQRKQEAEEKDIFGKTQGEILRLSGLVFDADMEIKKLISTRDELIEKRTKARIDYVEVKAQKDIALGLSFDSFKCPACGALYDSERLDELQSQFNTNKAQLIADTDSHLVAIAAEGKKCAKEIAEMEEIILGKEQAREALKLKQTELGGTLLNFKPVIIEPDPELKRLSDLIEAKRKEIDDIKRSDEVVWDQQRVKDRLSRLTEIANLLKKEDDYEEISSVIEGFQSERKAASEKLSEIEDTEFVLESFREEKTEQINNLINRMFQFAVFKFYNVSDSGVIKETCECTYNGVPYSALNTAMKVNIGIDIINTLADYHGIRCPIVIDNRESITQLTYTESQVISLVVDQDSKTLTIY